MLMKTILSLMFQGVIPMFLGLGGGQFAGQALSAEQAAAAAGNQYGAQAGNEGATLNPFFTQEMRATHAYTPGQENELLTAAEGGAGGAFGGAEGEIKRNAARTGNATAVTKSLDEMARDNARAGATASEGVAAADVAGAKQLNQEGASGLQGLYGTNVGAQLGAMKQQNADIDTENAVKGQNWLQQLNQIAGFGANVAGDITGGVKASDALQGR